MNETKDLLKKYILQKINTVDGLIIILDRLENINSYHDIEMLYKFSYHYSCCDNKFYNNNDYDEESPIDYEYVKNIIIENIDNIIDEIIYRNLLLGEMLFPIDIIDLDYIVELKINKYKNEIISYLNDQSKAIESFNKVIKRKNSDNNFIFIETNKMFIELINSIINTIKQNEMQKRLGPK